ncbi:MAG: hypothetical protein HYU64_18385 [Armatimonadetes bacterium]|nr:hypothetical protein [Armatimonadota bacterium]
MTRSPLELLKRAINIADGLLSQPLKGSSDLSLVAAHHLVIACRDAQGVLLLCGQELSDVALILVRRIWEDAVQLSFIKEKPEERVRQFREEAWVDAVRTLKLAQKKLSIGGAAAATAKALVSDSRFEETLGELKAMESQVSPDARKRATDKPGSLWKIRDMARGVGLEDQYDFFYHFLSERTHVGIDAAKDYFHVDETGQLRVSTKDYSVMASGLAATWLLFVAQVFAEAEGHTDEAAVIEGLFMEMMKSGL